MNTQFFGQLERICNAKGSKSKWTEKKERKKARKKFGAGNGKKKSKFWFMRMHQIKIFHIFVPNLGEIYLFGSLNSFFSETKAHLGPWQLK